MAIPKVICFIACHGGPADHFATFAEQLTQKGYRIHVYANGPALKKFEERKIEQISLYSLENIEGEDAALKLAEKCASMAAVITDVGHPFDVALQKALKLKAPHVLRLAYYDNPEPFVSGGYSSTAAKVMNAAQRVLFANGNLAKSSIYQEPQKEIPLNYEKRFPLGYYPLSAAENIKKRRDIEQYCLREAFFNRSGIQELGQRILVYIGGNNEEYFSKALPAFLKILKSDLPCIILYQQHPGAKNQNIDLDLIRKQTGGTQVYLSDMNTEDAQVIADGILYYQTSMSPQFVLAGIPLIQVGHQPFFDLVLKNGLCPFAGNREDFIKAVLDLERGSPAIGISHSLGLSSDWLINLEKVLK